MSVGQPTPAGEATRPQDGATERVRQKNQEAVRLLDQLGDRLPAVIKDLKMRAKQQEERIHDEEAVLAEVEAGLDRFNQLLQSIVAALNEE